VRTAIGREIPALLLSGDTSAAIQSVSDSGSFRLLSKPVDAEVLGTTIAILLSTQ
jgi:hypothetical protein